MAKLARWIGPLICICFAAVVAIWGVSEPFSHIRAASGMAGAVTLIIFGSWLATWDD